MKKKKSTHVRYREGSKELEYQRKTSAQRSQRNKGRRKKLAELTKKYGAAKAKKMMEGKDVDHVKPIKKGGTNSSRNLRLSKPSKNRSDKKMVGRKTKTKTKTKKR